MARRFKRSGAEAFGEAFQRTYEPSANRVMLEELGRLTDAEGEALGAPAGLSRDLLGAFLRGRESSFEQKRQDAQEERAATDFARRQKIAPVEEELATTQLSAAKEGLSQLKAKPGKDRAKDIQERADTIFRAMQIPGLPYQPDQLAEMAKTAAEIASGKYKPGKEGKGGSESPKADAMIRVKRKSDGKEGSMPASKFNEALYEKL